VATILLCSTPLYGHLAPLLALGRHLAERGHHVTVLTGSAFEERVHDAGLHHEALTGRADFDERDEASFLPEMHRHRGLALSRYQVEQTFVATLPEQHRAVRAVLDRERIDAVLTDSFFAGILPLLEADPASRPPILGVGIGPLVQVSRDVAPFNTALPPSATPLGRLRNRALNLLVARLLFAQTQRLAERLVQEAAGVPLRTFVLDFTAAFDRFVQLGRRSSSTPARTSARMWCSPDRFRAPPLRPPCPTGGPTSTTAARWCTSPRAPSTTTTSGRSSAPPSRRSRTRTCSSSSAPAARRSPRSARCRRTPAPRSSCPTSSCCR
jgi:hypothetical protein